MTAANLDAPGRILILKPSSLGDVVTAMPVLRGLRRSFPRAHITWLIAKSCVELIRHDGDLDDVILFDRKRLGQCWRSIGAAGDLKRFLQTLRAAKFDWVLDLQGLWRSGFFAFASGAPVRAGFADAREGAALFYTHKILPPSPHTVDRNIELARSLNVDAQPADFTLQLSAQGRQFAQQFLADQKFAGKDFVVCVPPTRWPTKVYAPRHWQRVIAELSRTTPVVITGTPGDKELCQAIFEGAQRQATPGGKPIVDLTGQTNVEQMVGLLSVSAGVICSDSAAKFIAPAVGTPALALLGPTRVELTGPYVPSPAVAARALLAPVPCQGCLQRRCRHISCMELLDPRQVVDAARELFGL